MAVVVVLVWGGFDEAFADGALCGGGVVAVAEVVPVLVRFVFVVDGVGRYVVVLCLRC